MFSDWFWVKVRSPYNSRNDTSKPDCYDNVQIYHDSEFLNIKIFLRFISALET